MRRQRLRIIAAILWVVCHSASGGPESLHYVEQTLVVDSQSYRVRVPSGLHVELLTAEMNEPRLLTFGGNGDLFVGSKSGNVYRLVPPYTTPQVLVKLAGYPHSVALRKSEILIARTDGLYRAPYQLGQTSIARDDVSLLAALPGGGGHTSRSVAIGPDGRVYLSLGITSNCSDQFLDESYPFDDRRGGVLVLREHEGKPKWETFASGLRNPVGFAWHPQTAVMYASNNGPDHWGFDLPPEYFSRITQGSFHGMPWFQYDGSKIERDDCIKRAPPISPTKVVTPVATFPARSAPMGVTFVSNNVMLTSFASDAIVALRGSWGTQPSGGFFGSAASRRQPKLVVVRFKDGVANTVEDLVTGFQLENGDRWARPVGVAVGPDGALYFSSDSGINGLFRLVRDRGASSASAEITKSEPIVNTGR